MVKQRATGMVDPYRDPQEGRLIRVSVTKIVGELNPGSIGRLNR